MANPYPANFTDDSGTIVRESGAVDFTDPGNQPGGSVPALTEYIGASFTVSAASGDPAGFFYLQYSDLQSAPKVLGSDLSLVDAGSQAVFETASGGSFDMGIYYSLRLTANPNDGTLRWIQMYADSSGAAPDPPGVYSSLGMDDLRPMIDGKNLDFGARALNPYVDLPPGTQFGGISFSPVVGSATDVFHLGAIVAVWKIAPLPT